MEKKDTTLYQLEAVRELAKSERIIDPRVIHDTDGFTFHFDKINKNDSITKDCVLITMRGALPRVFKKAQTYVRILHRSGIKKWRVEKNDIQQTR